MSEGLAQGPGCKALNLPESHKDQQHNI